MSYFEATDRHTLALFSQAAWRHKRLLLLSALNPIGTICMSTLTPLYIGKALAALTHSTAQAQHYLPYIFVVGIFGFLLNRFGFAYMLEFQAHAMGDLQMRTLRTLLGRSIGFHNDNVGGKLVSDAIDFVGAFSQLTSAVLNGMLSLFIILLSGSIIIFFDSWEMGAFILGMTVLIMGMGIAESRRRSGVRKNRLRVTKNLTSHLADSIVNAQTVKTFAREPDELSRHAKLNNALLKLRIHDWRTAAYGGSNRIGILMLFQLLFVVLSIHLVKHDPRLLGIGIFAFTFTMTLSNRLFEVNVLLRNIEDALLQASPMTEIMLETPEILDAPGAKPLEVKDGKLELRDVTFSYHDGTASEPVFQKLNLHVRPGERVGLVGPSGGGKSTLTRLLLRFEDIDDGEITIDGQNIAGVTQRSVRQAISYVPQEPLLFHRPVRENIAYGKPGASLQTIRQAAKMAHADEFIRSLNDGYDTVVGERGVKLSGGQRQRVAIARAMLKNAPILILDEATSALDSESEVLIQDALWKLMQDRTAIVIAHRLSTIQKMDRIIVLDGGAIVEEGSHKELLDKKGLYAKLWAHQSGGFLEE